MRLNDIIAEAGTEDEFNNKLLLLKSNSQLSTELHDYFVAIKNQLKERTIDFYNNLVNSKLSLNTATAIAEYCSTRTAHHIPPESYAGIETLPLMVKNFMEQNQNYDERVLNLFFRYVAKENYQPPSGLENALTKLSPMDELLQKIPRFNSAIAQLKAFLDNSTAKNQRNKKANINFETILKAKNLAYKGNWNEMIAAQRKLYEEEASKPREQQNRELVKERRRNIVACKIISRYEKLEGLNLSTLADLKEWYLTH